MTHRDADAAWTWRRLEAAVPPPALRRAIDLLSMGQVDLHDASGEHVAGRAGEFDASAARTTGASACSCGHATAEAPCAHAAALLAADARLAVTTAPPSVREATRIAFGPREPPVPVPAFPETATDLEVPADALSSAQRAAVEAVPGVVRKSATAYTLPRDEAPALAATLEALGTTLVTFARRPYVRFRASVRAAGERRAHLTALETPGASVRIILERRGFRPLRRPKSLVHEFDGPLSELHLAAEEMAARGTAVILGEGAPPTFEPLSVPQPRPTPRQRTGAPTYPLVFSRRRFEWWTPRTALSPLQAAVLQRHGVVSDREARLTGDGLRAAERELLTAGVHVLRVDDSMPVMAEAEEARQDGLARVRARQRAMPDGARRALGHHGFAAEAGGFVGPAAALPSLVAALAQHGVHVLPAPGGWPAIPPGALHEPPIVHEDPRLPLAREGQLVHDAAADRVFVQPTPPEGVLSRSLRIELHRMGWLDGVGRAAAPASEAGRLFTHLRDAGLDVRWPKPTSGAWRLASVRYNERSSREGGGTLLHIKGPLPLGRLGGQDPGAEAARIAEIVRAMEDALKRHHPDARPLAHGALPGVWSVDGGAGAFLLEAASKGASVSAAPALNPIPLGRGVILADTSCLPPRIREYRSAAFDEADEKRPVVSPEIENVIRRVVPQGLELDADQGHYLVPSTRIAPLLAALRELGAKVLQRRLAPRGKRYARWEPKLPEDETGARPKLRPRWSGEPYKGAIPGLRKETKLDPHQREAVAFILDREYKCLLADEMGLGKTLTAIAAAQFLPGRVLVVCPASARSVWKQEVLGWTTERVRVLEPANRASDVALHDAGEKYVVVAYSGLAKFADELAKIPFDLVVLDESHYVKSRAAQRTKLVHEKLQQIPRRLILSGTPVMNEPAEVRTQIAFVHPEEWSDTAWFGRRFQMPWKHGTQDVKDAVLARLREYLEGVMLRREKRQALPDLPDKHLHVHRIALPTDARRAYDEQEDAFRDYVRDNEDTALTRDMSTTAGRLEGLKQIALAGKLPLILDELRAMLDRGEKLVIFCHYREPIKAMARELADHGVVTLTGSTKPADRGDIVKKFQKDEATRVFIGQTVAAGVAVTLTAARHAVFTDLEWNPALHRQAMDRIHRKTQTRNVEVHFYLAEDTVEEDIAEVLEEKAEMMDQLLEGRKGGTFGLRDREVAQREVALRILSRRRRLRATADGDDADD